MNYGRQRPWVGRSRSTGKLEVFRSRVEPTEETHGKIYRYSIGPFKTVRGARYMATYGGNNPHCVTVADAEKLAAKHREKCTWQTATGMPWTEVCGKPCIGPYCEEHRRDLRECYPHLEVPS